MVNKKVNKKAKPERAVVSRPEPTVAACGEMSRTLGNPILTDEAYWSFIQMAGGPGEVGATVAACVGGVLDAVRPPRILDAATICACPGSTASRTAMG